MSEQPAQRNRPEHALHLLGMVAFAAFFLSGASSLVFQTLWSRLLSHVFGSSSIAVSSVVSVFMGGLGLGAYVFGKRAERMRDPLLLYAVAELGVGAMALVIPHWLQCSNSRLQRAMNAAYRRSRPARSQHCATRRSGLEWARCSPRKISRFLPSLSSAAISRTSARTSCGEIHAPLVSRPQPSQERRTRSASRRRRRASGTEKTMTDHLPSQDASEVGR